MKAQHEFKLAEWNHAGKMNSQRGRCRSCQNQQPDLRLCSVCKERLNDKTSKCDKCSGPEMQEHVTRQCTKCEKRRKQIFFSNDQWCKRSGERTCRECCEEPSVKQCAKCKKQLTQIFFSNSQWCRKGAERKCYECCAAPSVPKKHGEWLCVRHGCRKTLPKMHFCLWMEEKKKQYRNNRQVCNQCFVKDRQAEEEQNRTTHTHLQKRHSEAHSKK